MGQKPETKYGRCTIHGKPRKLNVDWTINYINALADILLSLFKIQLLFYNKKARVSKHAGKI